MSSNAVTSVKSVNRGVESGSAGGGAAPSTERLEAFIGSWLTEGYTINPDGSEGLPILCSDVYEWGPAHSCVVHSAYGRIGETNVGGLEILGPGENADTFVSYFHDAFGNMTTSSLVHEDGDWFWQGEATRCRGEVDAQGTMHAHHSRREEDGSWVASMTVHISRRA